jgi:hypothetical protein
MRAGHFSCRLLPRHQPLEARVAPEQGAYGTGNTQCKVTGLGASSAQVRCFAPSGLPMDSYYMVLLAS